MLEEARRKKKCLGEEVMSFSKNRLKEEREKTWAFQEGKGGQYLMGRPDKGPLYGTCPIIKFDLLSSLFLTQVFC